MRVLLAEDDVRLLKSLKYILEKHDFVVDGVDNGDDALDYALMGEYDAMVFDVMMPGKDGFEVLKAVRAKGITTPVMFLTAKSQIEDRVEGLDIGADDYLTKPFFTDELLARIRAMLRRKDAFVHDVMKCVDITIDKSTYEVSVGDRKVSLSNKEFQLLEKLVEGNGSIISTEQFITSIWGFDADVDTSVIWAHMSNLRKKMESLGCKVKIKYIRGAGYTLKRE